MKTELLLELLHYVKKNFPYAERITSYGTAKDVLRKSEEELVALRKAGLAMIYLGAESGDDEVLVHIQKGETAAEIIAAGQKLKRCGIQTSVTLISGLGGSAGMEAQMHVLEWENEQSGLARKAMEEAGVTVSVLRDENEWKRIAVEKIWPDYYEFIGGKAVIDMIQKELER